ncbi:response regulator [Hyalangium versicolor]|uniref:response regulator n=1 Tax=Hyalangium versicolor TaxID=2861190 RepID=UPI001CC921FA|nr:response regulator [Hyalangium versicolor]
MSKRRILVIDDSEDIHKDFKRILCPGPSQDWEELARLEEALFGVTPPSSSTSSQIFEVDTVFQGRDGVAKVREAMAEGRPYALVFLDYRMPPGWNGFETLRHLRKVSPTVPVVLCSAFSDYSLEDMRREFGEGHRLTELRKPFNKNEVYELALALTEEPQGASSAKQG